MHLVVDKVVQLEDMHVANRRRSFEGVAASAVKQMRLGARSRQPLGLGNVVRIGQPEHPAYLFFRRAVEYRRGKSCSF